MKYKENLLIPALLDAHFPLMKYAFYSREYQPVILNNRRNVTGVGLRYVHNDMCYPCILNTGQMIAALQSGKFDLEHTRLLMPSVGDACRGSNYTEMLRKAVKKAGFPQVRVMTLNLRHIDEGNQIGVSPEMVWRAFFALFYGDLLLILTQQVRPYEREAGAANRCRDKWYGILGSELKAFRNLKISVMLRRFSEITADFAAIPRTGEKKRRIGIVGELYTKYCALGNWDMVQFLEDSGCESFTNGLSWYVLYYIDSHLAHAGNPAEAAGYRAIGAVLEKLQKKMIAAIAAAGFFTLPTLHTLKAEVAGKVRFEAAIGDGWLIATESAGYILHGCKKVLAIQPFGCMPNHVIGRGLYASLQRKCGGQIVSIDADSSLSPVNAYNRARMLMNADEGI
ncbi:MAG TPA: hypothetical protein DCG49_02135 [Ruminococcus sp.]|nr:hypothetical protein [Ruminococcus sp.]